MTVQFPNQVSSPKTIVKHSDHNTVTTASDSSEDHQILVPTKNMDKPKSKSGKGRRRRKSGSSGRKHKNANREMLMGLIAQEMTSSWKEEESASMLPEDPIAGLSAADIFYAQMNGEAFDSTGSMRSTGSSSEKIVLPEEDEHDEIPDHTSFAGLAFPGHDELPEQPIPEDLSVSRRSSSSRATHSCRSDTSRSDDTLSVDEIQRYVMDHMPDEIKEKIPKEAWNRIFGKSSIDKTRKPSGVPVEDEEDVKVDQEDDSSVISDITEYTGFDKAKTKPSRTMAPLSPEEEKEQSEELCPVLDIDQFPSDYGERMSLRTDMSGSIQRSKSSNSPGVNFARVEVRYYERVLEVNPAVTSGAAIGIGWRYRRGGVLSVDDWELNRGEIRKANDLIMPRGMREGILRDLGYTQKDIATATRIILKAKNNRKVTVQNLPNQHMEEAVEKAARKVKGLLSFGRNKGLVAH